MIPKLPFPIATAISAIVLLLFSAPAMAALGIRQDGHLDMPVLRKAYMESEFELVRASLEGFLKKHPKDVSREEKVFTHMYLGVICAADSNSQVKAESHFNALLQLSPHIEPVDMFVPPKIQDLFDRIKRDYLKREEYEKRFDAFGNPIQPEGSDSAAHLQTAKPADPDNPSGKSTDGKTPALTDDGSRSWLWWTVGSAAVVAAGVGVYAIMASEDAPEPNRSEVDGTLK
ncbi:MAG: hypothetical protein JWP91_4167 [Fibrobacteres bacterium]|nr:hypothetical protein [Fibrobacterota bacterium]